MSAKKRKPAPARKRPRANGSSVGETGLPASNPKKKPFEPEDLGRTVIALPLLKDINDEAERLQREPGFVPKPHNVVIDLNLEFPGGRDKARAWVEGALHDLLSSKQPGLKLRNKPPHPQYLFAALSAELIQKLVRNDGDEADPKKRELIDGAPFRRAIFHIWPDFAITRLVNKSISTVKADAAHASFSALGEGIVWAVLDSGIASSHPHFKLHENLKLEPPLKHMDFTGSEPEVVDDDPNGHGTHVAGIIAGEAQPPVKGKRNGLLAYVRHRDEKGQIVYQSQRLEKLVSMAPACKLVSFRVLDENGDGEASNIMAAIAKIQEINDYGRRLLIHGVNISVGNEFEPEWFACGQSPLCVEVNRLVHSGVVVVVAAGNSGYGSLKSQHGGVISAGMSLTINDPGNADLAITVGSTHRDMPHLYGVSYFSSKGPTGDGRLKPDLIAPGEKVISCAAGRARQEVPKKFGRCDYVEDSGTSMAAPHVSGVIAAFLSVRREFIGHPMKVKEIFLSTATDLRRERYFQGAGLVDLMRAIQSV